MFTAIQITQSPGHLRTPFPRKLSFTSKSFETGSSTSINPVKRQSAMQQPSPCHRQCSGFSAEIDSRMPGNRKLDLSALTSYSGNTSSSTAIHDDDICIYVFFILRQSDDFRGRVEDQFSNQQTELHEGSAGLRGVDERQRSAPGDDVMRSGGTRSDAHSSDSTSRAAERRDTAKTILVDD